MKKNILIAVFCAFMLCTCVCADDLGGETTNFDYNFLDNAFSNPNPTTNKQFEEVMSRFEKKKNSGLWYKIKKFFNGSNPMYDETFKTKYETPDNQPSRIKDKPEDKSFITIGFDFTDSTGKFLPAGHYQVECQKSQTGYTINLLQGKTRAAIIAANETSDDWETPAVIYTRTVAVSENVIKIIHSNLDLTIAGYIRAADKSIEE